MKELEKIIEIVTESVKQQLALKLTPHWVALEKERDESNRVRKEYFKKIQDLSKELSELKIKEDIAYTAKEIAEKAYQEAQQELQTLKDVGKGIKKRN